MWNGLGYTPSMFQTVVLFDEAWNHEYFSIINFIFPYFKLFFNCIIVFIPCMEISLIFCLCFYILCRRGNNHFDVHFQRIGPYLFLSKDGKDPVREGRNGRKGVYLPPESASFPFDKYYDYSTFPYLYLDLACKQLCSPPKKNINRRNKCTIIII